VEAGVLRAPIFKDPRQASLGDELLDLRLKRDAGGALEIGGRRRGAAVLARHGDRAYPKLLYFHEVDSDGHFAAWEEPELFAAEMRAAFRPLRA
jgi:hypothetical protein